MSTFRVLVADDNPDDRWLALRELQREWAVVDAVEVFDEAGLEGALALQEPDLVVTDYHLMFANGLEILERVRAVWPDVPVIMLTGTGTEEIAVQAMHSGLDDYILKNHTARLGTAARAAVAKRAEARETRLALIESEARFRALADSSSLLIWMSDTNSGVTFLSRGWLDLRGVPTERDLGFGWLEAVHPDDRDAVEGQVRERERGPFSHQYRILSASGEYRTMVDSGSPWVNADGTFLGYVGTTVDITDQLNAERMRYEAEVLLTTALDASPVGVGYVDTALRYVRVNRRLGEFHDLSPDEHIGRTVADVLLPLGVDVERHYRTVLSTGEAMTDVPIRANVGGEMRRYIASYHPVLLDGDVTGVGIVSVDVTERERLEAQLLQAQKLEAVGRLAGGLAHDFNNLLSVVDGYASLIAETLPESDERHAQALEISRASMRGAALTRQLLSFSRQVVLDESNLDLRSLVAELTAMLERLVPDNVSLVLEVDETPAVVYADAGRLGQVIVNLVVNAIDAIRGDGEIVIRVAVRGQSVVLEVRDTGVGIDDATKELLFEPFFTTKPHGTGLGLATAHGAVQQVGGQIEVTSSVGVGTTFTITLPRVDAAPDDREDAVAFREPIGTPAGGEAVLVVEDSELLRDLVRSILSRAGFVVRVAKDGRDALDVIRASGVPDVVVADVEMPNIGGIELAGRLEKLYPDVRILLMSGYSADAASSELQGTHFLQKPFTPAELSRRVRALLAG